MPVQSFGTPATVLKVLGRRSVLVVTLAVGDEEVEENQGTDSGNSTNPVPPATLAYVMKTADTDRDAWTDESQCQHEIENHAQCIADDATDDTYDNK